jgi:Fe-S oxidoreductase
MQAMWEVRESSLGSTAFVPGMHDTWGGWEDSAVPVAQIAPYLRDLKKLFDKFGFYVSTYGHFSQGIVHCRIPFDLYTRKGVDQYHQFMNEATDLVLSYGGSLSGEHGDGQSRAMYLPKMFGQKLVHAFGEFKRIWDPQWKMNPGKVVDPYSITDNLRISPDYNPPQPRTYFQYPSDDHAFSRAVLRCVGVGKCRRDGGVTMCPCYRVTREEKHSTRGRARLLFEMMNGEILEDGWRDDAVHEALDLCLACKGCKGDCPVNVDMATYKAEFRAHYFEKRIRPRFMYAFGWINLAAKFASYAPMIANFFTQAPVLNRISKFIAGAHQKRHLPAFAPQSFKSWFAAREPRNRTGKPVVLYADTFNNYFRPETARAAVEVLEDAGFTVIVPKEDLCCGRPLYDYGFLGMAKRWLKDNLEKLRPYIEADVPMVVLEPGCWSVFADEMGNLYPNDWDAKRLRKNVFLLAEFLKDFAPDYQPPKLHRKALLHKHCHHKAELKHVEKAQDELLKKMGVDVREPETGCCGMAGAFGYEPGDHYDVSVKCGQRVLIPEVDKAKDDELIIADGFSCREQIHQMSDRDAMHLAEVIQFAKHHPSFEGDRPEQPMVSARQCAYRRAAITTGSLVALGVVAGMSLYAARRRQSRSQVFAKLR